MTIHFQRELTHLRKQILTVGATVESAISNAITALLNRDVRMAEQVLAGDRDVDRMEIEVEEECLKILALHQPVATDLRFIVAVLKMNNDLERMGDHAANMAKKARFLARHDPEPWPPEIEAMAERTKEMVGDSLEALINQNAGQARRVWLADQEVDRYKRQIADQLRQRLLGGDAAGREALLKMLDIPRHLERIADLATNIAEDVVYMTEGAITRHRHEE